MNANGKQGFTLLEVLMALFVLSLTINFLPSLKQAKVQISKIERQTLAYWIAENKYTDLSMVDWEELAGETEEVEMAGILWEVDVEIKQEASDLKQIIVTVTIAVDDLDVELGDEYYDARLIGFMGEH